MPGPLPTPSEHIRHFRLDPNTVYLNHGSFGACPTLVVEAQARHRDRMEADAVRFFVEDVWGLLDRSRVALAPIVGTAAANLVFVPNATTGVTTVLHNLALRAGDEILVTGNEYTACVNNCRAMAAHAGATVVAAALPWPIPGPDAVVDAVLSKVTAQTRVAMFSLVTSATGTRLPVEALLEALHARGIDTILDAAHGPGCVLMDLDRWNPTFATGNCHKWLCAPKGAAFLYVRPERQTGFRPLVLSNDAERLPEAAARTARPHWHHEFDYTGTDDVTARISIADAVAFMQTILPGGGGLDRVMADNHALSLRARNLVCARLGVAPPVPDAMLGPMATITLPKAVDAVDLWKRMYGRHRIQIPVWATPAGATSIRLSAQVYNDIGQYAYLAEALAQELVA